MAATTAAKKPQKRSSKSPASREAAAKKPAKAVAKRRKVATTKTTTAKARTRTARSTNGNVVTPAAWGMAQRTQELIDVLGGVSALARVLGVSPSQPSRWRAGKEEPGPEMAKRLIDLDHVVARAGLVWHPKTVRIWLVSANGHLNGATPMGVLGTRGSSEVLRALDATEQGAFA